MSNIQIDETNGEYIIRNVRARTLSKALSAFWSSKIPKYMFTNYTGNWISLRKFFIMDLYYMVDFLYTEDTSLPYVESPKHGIKDHLGDLRHALKKHTWLADIDKTFPPRLNLTKLKELNYQPLDFQLAFLKTYSESTTGLGLRGTLLAAAPGSGKTYTTLALAHCADADRIIVICPKNALHRVWEDNIDKVFKTPQTYWLSDNPSAPKKERILVYHYERLEDAMTLSNHNEKIVVILDESHNLNEMSAARTQHFLAMVKKLSPSDIIFASGTAVKALGAEVVPLFLAIDPRFDMSTAARFVKIHGRSSRYTLDIIKFRLGLTSFKVEKEELGLAPPKMITLGVTFKNANDYTLEEIAKEIAIYAKERLAYYKANEVKHQERFYQILTEYQSKLTDRKEISMSVQYRKSLATVIKAYHQGGLFHVPEEMAYCNRYEAMLSSYMPTVVREEFRELKTVVKYVKLKVQGECLGRVVGRKRIDCHVKMAGAVKYDDILLSTPKKTVIFSSFTEVVFAAERACAKQYHPVCVYGKTNKDLSSILSRFESDKKVNPLIATYASLSTAVPLVMADTMIMIDVPFRAYVQEQAISRIHRLGSDTKTTVYTCVLDTGEKLNISSRSVDILKWSQEQVEAILGIKSPFEIKALETEDTPVNDTFSIESFYHYQPDTFKGWTHE